MDTNEMAKGWRELYKNTAYSFEQIQEASPYKTTAVRALTSHLINLASKDQLISDILLWTPTYEQMSVC